jgi:hypothetical protein
MTAVALDRAPDQLQRHVGPARLMGCDSEAVQRVGVMGIELKYLLIEAHRLGKAPGLMQAGGLEEPSLDEGRRGRREGAPLPPSRAALLAIHEVRTVTSGE